MGENDRRSNFTTDRGRSFRKSGFALVSGRGLNVEQRVQAEICTSSRGSIDSMIGLEEVIAYTSSHTKTPSSLMIPGSLLTVIPGESAVFSWEAMLGSSVERSPCPCPDRPHFSVGMPSFEYMRSHSSKTSEHPTPARIFFFISADISQTAW